MAVFWTASTPVGDTPSYTEIHRRRVGLAKIDSHFHIVGQITHFIDSQHFDCRGAQRSQSAQLSGTADGDSVDVTGGWHDASDYLQYLPTSANTVYQLLFAYSMQPEIWGDAFDASGRPGANGVPDIVDEARWGLEWMCRMNPSDGVYYNQIADDRDHPRRPIAAASRRRPSVAAASSTSSTQLSSS